MALNIIFSVVFIHLWALITVSLESKALHSTKRMQASKESGPNSFAHLKRALIFEWCVVRCGSMNEHQKDMYLKEIEPSTQNNVNHFRFNRQHSWGELYNHFVRKRMLTFGND